MSPLSPQWDPFSYTFGCSSGSAEQKRDGLPSCSYSNGLNEMVTFTEGIQEWEVPHTGTYRIQAKGAGGGIAQGNDPGQGYVHSADFHLTAGTKLKILVGMKPYGTTAINSAGGGGGSFVATGSNDFLIVAGGGCGSTNTPVSHTECDGRQPTTSGCGGAASLPGYAGGCDGMGPTYVVERTSGWGGSGAGARGDGIHEIWSGSESTISKSFLNGGKGGTRWGPNRGGHGGFGGGGGCGNYGGGGGGGYSGGAAGKSNGVKGGGGGSWVNPDATNKVNSGATNANDGAVIISTVG